MRSERTVVDSKKRGTRSERKLNGHGSTLRTVVRRRHTRSGAHPFDEITWETRSATISDVFRQDGVVVPSFWSQQATNIVAQKYFRGHVGTPGREYSVKQLISRVADTIAQWGLAGDYFDSVETAETFRAELAHMLVHQRAAFNSPVWFNVGVEDHPQCSACFIQSVGDSMESILELARNEGMIFKHGSGTGSNLSGLRSSREKLNGGGTSSGPVAFMKGFDSFAGVIKSGGKTRRAAKMVILNVDHPDILSFIRCKANEERKAHALIDAGYSGEFNVADGAYDSIQFQNANNSVRVTDDFMSRVVEDRVWTTRNVVDGAEAEEFRAKAIWKEIAEAAWVCGDPGVQFDTVINDWHTCPNTARINASNPCSEYMFLDDSACNLASLNLMKYRVTGGSSDGAFDYKSFLADVALLTLAMEIIVGYSKYPTAAIEKNSHDYRPLGLGYANLGAFVMSNGWAYDSDEAREFAASITAMLTGHAYATSARIAGVVGPFAGYEKNREPFLHVMDKHRDAASKLAEKNPSAILSRVARDVWNDAVAEGRAYGFRNAQASVIAPTGTISFMMDCDTTGIEPDIALAKHKKLVGGGTIKMVNTSLDLALRHLGYSEADRGAIVKWVSEHGTVEGSSNLREEHLPVFDCAFASSVGGRSIHYRGHLRMMAAVQPFVSGAISKTVNMPNEATVDEIADTYLLAWELGLKAVAIYRDGCKRTQPMNTKAATASAQKGEVVAAPARRYLPEERKAITHKFVVQNYEGYITVGMFEDGTPGEIFLTMSKEGALVSGLMDAFATSISFNLQYGVPLAKLVDKFSHMRFEPSGYTNNPRIPIAKSIIDYVFRWLADKFLTDEQRVEAGVNVGDVLALKAVPVTAPAGGGARADQRTTFVGQADAPPCHVCGDQMVRNAACYLCRSCGASSGCS